MYEGWTEAASENFDSHFLSRDKVSSNETLNCCVEKTAEEPGDENDLGGHTDLCDPLHPQRSAKVHSSSSKTKSYFTIWAGNCSASIIPWGNLDFGIKICVGTMVNPLRTFFSFQLVVLFKINMAK